nr:MAG TPA: hypothetical protein [Caudoviricetes sp.]
MAASCQLVTTSNLFIAFIRNTLCGERITA